MNCRVLPALVGASLVLVGLVGCSRDPGPAGGAQPDAEVFTPSHPSSEAAFQELYATQDAKAHLVDKTHMAKPWFATQFADGEADHYVVFAEVQELDEAGRVNDCHACAPSIDAITYTKGAKGWGRGVIQRRVGELGSWGAAPEVKAPEIIQLIPGNVVLGIPEVNGGQGISHKWLNLLDHFQGAWQFVGAMKLAEDNKGSGCSETGAPNEFGQCYAFEGKFRLAKGRSLTFPDFVVTKTGTEFASPEGNVVPARVETYSFDGKKYVSDLDQQGAAPNGTGSDSGALAAGGPREPGSVQPHSAEARRAADDLQRCVSAAAQSGPYSSLDGGKSALAILNGRCGAQFEAWTVECVREGTEAGICRLASAMGVQVALKGAGK